MSEQEIKTYVFDSHLTRTSDIYVSYEDHKAYIDQLKAEVKELKQELKTCELDRDSAEDSLETRTTEFNLCSEDWAKEKQRAEQAEAKVQKLKELCEKMIQREITAGCNVEAGVLAQQLEQILKGDRK